MLVALNLLPMEVGVKKFFHAFINNQWFHFGLCYPRLVLHEFKSFH